MSWHALDTADSVREDKFGDKQGARKRDQHRSTSIPVSAKEKQLAATYCCSQAERARPPFLSRNGKELVLGIEGRGRAKLQPLWPPPSSHFFRDLFARQLPRLRVAIFNALPGSRVSPHPAAICCRTALVTPWFYSKAVARFTQTSAVHMENGAWMSVLPPVKVELLQAEDICAGRLVRPSGPYSAGYDVLLVPGGSAKADFLALGPEGCEALRGFVESGGGYCGVCAGAFLAHRLRLLDAEKRIRSAKCDSDESDEESHVKASRRPFLVKAKFTSKGRKLLWHEGRPKSAEVDESMKGEVCMRYHNGPLLVVGASAKALCRMSALEEAHDAQGTLTGSAGIVMQNYGGGRVVAISPHPESTTELLVPEPGKERLRRVLQRAVLLSAAGPAAHSWLESDCHMPA